MHLSSLYPSFWNANFFLQPRSVILISSVPSHQSPRLLFLTFLTFLLLLRLTESLSPLLLPPILFPVDLSCLKIFCLFSSMQFYVRSKLRELVGASTNWRDHVQAMNERKSLHTLLAKTQADLSPRKMKDSYIEVILPLGSQPEIREKYLNMQNTVRFGRILEDLDSLAVLICYTHTKNEDTLRSPLSIVTALVDKIGLWKQHIHPDCDIKFTGNVSWVGKTSMEVKIHMLQLLDAIYCPVLDATFVMVARDPENKRPAFVNPLIAETPEEEKIFKEGEKNKTRRLESSRASLLKVAPTADERNIIHNMFLNTLDSRTVSFRSRVLLPNSVWMEDTKLKGLEICHPQERNIFNRIFGGFLMRKAYELGWATAYSYGFVILKKITSRFGFIVKFMIQTPGYTTQPMSFISHL
ncbi:acyl-coenzyme A thioesterase 9, mitochondrial isoform X3 [Thamnophis elegans]|uniref:acyl-coenzyme A thioesterase 9, mitochondrial isoform X3 n=1 Tax=Thamnophis elegans TaxID=35005 RepID=UPI0013783448|nr:acyl-coenzyme A thioesterase 9, mitochondrial isoform X3 [Thamnophis elegans]